VIESDLHARLHGMAERLRKDARSGSAIIEFAMLAPIFLLLLFSIMEIGILFFAQSTLQHSTEIVGRLIRTGQVQGQNLSQAQVRQIVCNNAAPLIPCDSNLYVDVEAFTNFNTVVFSPPLDGQGHMNPLNNFQPGAPCNVVLVRVFYAWRVLTPGLTPFLDSMAGDRHLIYTAAAFRNEPYSVGISGC